LIAVLVKVMSPPTCGSKKSAERRWASRWELFVEMEAALITTEMAVSSGSVVVVIAPANSLKVPRTLLIRCRAVKPIVVCAGSRVHRPATRPVWMSCSVILRTPWFRSWERRQLVDD
jgi:hypothetical protein